MNFIYTGIYSNKIDKSNFLSVLSLLIRYSGNSALVTLFTLHTPISVERNPTVSPQSTVVSFQSLSRHISNAIEPNRTQSNLSSPIERNRTFDWVRLLKFFVRVRFCSITELNRTQSRDWVRLSSIEFD